MILPDVNVLLMAVNAAGSEHRAARDALTEGLDRKSTRLNSSH